MNLFNMWGTGNDLNTGSFVTLNGEKVKDSIADFRKAFSEANLLGGTKKGTLFSWLAGDFNKDYDLAKDLDKDVVALQEFKIAYDESGDKVKAVNKTLKDASVVLQDFVNHTDDANISVENFFRSVTGASKLTNAIKGIGLQMLTTAAQAAAIWAITEGFRLVVNAIKDYINRAEIAKEKMENSKKAYQDTTDEIKSLNHSAFILTVFRDAKVILSQVAGHLLLLKSSNYSRLVSKEILCTEIQIVLFNKFNTKIALYSRHFTSRFHVFVYQAACQLLPSLSPYQLSPFSLSRQIPSFGRLF